MSSLGDRSLPWVTVSMAAAAMAATSIPLVGQMMVFDRTAIIHGEFWRLISGHLYHYSSAHLWSNVLPLVVVGAWIEKKSRQWFAVGCLLIALACGASLFLFRPDMVRYGGLSGMLCGLLVYFGLGLSVEKNMLKWMGRFTVAVMVAKSGYEWHVGPDGLLNWDAHGFEVMPLAHLTGLIAGTVWFMIRSVVVCDWVAFGERIHNPAIHLGTVPKANPPSSHCRKESRWIV